MSRPEAPGPAGGPTGPPAPAEVPTDAEPPVSGIEILSAVSHELRTPLVSIQGYTSLLLHRWENLADDDKRMMLEQVHHDAERVTRLIGELLDVGRLETGRLVVQRQLVDLPALAASVADRIRLQHPDLEVTAVWPRHFPRVYADPDKIEQVLTNLLENACKYASPKGVTITGVNPAGAVTVTVADRGPGIAPGDLPEVFTKFFRRAEGRPDGLGLGLWISRGLIESHGGRLVAESIPGEGSAFRFTLPLVDLEDPQYP
jgi:signal transduction histidine kinase